MHEIAFQLGGLTVRSYGVMAAAGFLLGVLCVTAVKKHAAMNSDQAGSAVLWAMIGGIVGARIFYVVQYFEHYRDNLAGIFRIDQGGLVFYGGFFLAIAAIFCYCRRQKLDFVAVLDTFAPALAVAHACGRIGCFLNGCCWGGKTSGALGVVYPAGSPAYRETCGERVYPAQLFEAGALLLSLPLFFYLCRKAPRGIAAGTYIVFYGLLRFCIEFFRGDNPVLLGLTPAQWIGLVMIPAGVAVLIFFRRRGRSGKADK